MGKTYRNGIGKLCNFFLGRNFFVGGLDLLILDMLGLRCMVIKMENANKQLDMSI